MRLCSTMWAYVIAQTGYVVRLIRIQGGTVSLGKKNGNVSGYWCQFFRGTRLLKVERNGCEGDVGLLCRGPSHGMWFCEGVEVASCVSGSPSLRDDLISVNLQERALDL